MNELKTLVINGVAYAITDETKLPQPETAKVGDTLRVDQVDDQGRPLLWGTYQCPALVTAIFESMDDAGETYMCPSHTAEQLIRLVNDGYAVIGILRDIVAGTSKSFFCFTEGTSRIVVGDALMDGGWQHCVGDPGYYSDNGKELWIAY